MANTNFENFIIKCCEMDEWDLRDFLRDKLKEVGFTVQEDDYVSHRPGQFRKIRNMLAIRGENAAVCLVAHTDVCRDHNGKKRGQKAIPVVKEVKADDKIVRVIQDKFRNVQVGGDDRLGVAINVWIAMNTGYDMGLLFTTDEECGALSAEECTFPELMKFDLCVEVDRGNHSNQLVTHIGNTQLCSPEMRDRLLDIADSIELPREEVRGMLTDVLEIKRKGRCKEAVNMTCGYHNSVGSSPNEFIIVEEAYDCMRYVSEIIKDFELESINTLSVIPDEN